MRDHKALSCAGYFCYFHFPEEYFSRMKMSENNRVVSAQDRKILHELQQNARLSNAELAERVGMSPSACWNHTRQLENDGYIQGYVALINQQKMGLPDIPSKCPAIAHIKMPQPKPRHKYYC
ncbi:Lrp/AsnC family transcriptional regulator [Vogesella indigofera]|uniref:Lrp/AsnC family transcriptional regulator n=1 Tax=Vogesella indigofera TaxID=45465 RepID=UPI00234EFE9F|nr:Lrp/AsnC family transcriptional regulator [Vogesella indigofera]MDC7701722.1 Lrp/AsnC family transcriptional regulator [Vogesella indigofera]